MVVSASSGGLADSYQHHSTELHPLKARVPDWKLAITEWRFVKDKLEVQCRKAMTCSLVAPHNGGPVDVYIYTYMVHPCTDKICKYRERERERVFQL